MSGQLMKWQLAACGVLSAVLLAEWTVGEASRKQLQATLDKKIQSDYQSESLPTLNLTKQVAEGFDVIVERPLFIEGRKPLPEQVSESPDTSDNGQLEDWLLIGIYTKDQRKMALFRKQNEARNFLKLNQTQMISGWQLMQIQSDRVVLQQGGQQKSIMLRKPRAQTNLTPPGRRPVTPVKPVKPQVPTNNNSPENEQNDS